MYPPGVPQPQVGKHCFRQTAMVVFYFLYPLCLVCAIFESWLFTELYLIDDSNIRPDKAEETLELEFLGITDGKINEISTVLHLAWFTAPVLQSTCT